LTSAEWFDQELYKELGFDDLSAWDESATFKGYEGWTGEDLLAMAGMWQRGDISRCVKDVDGNLDKALKHVDARVLLMPCETDQYFRPYVSEREVKSLKGGRVAVVPSIWGHIAGGGANEKDIRWMEERIAEFLKGGYGH
jgi:homoserine O-acetyltransferase